MHEIELARRRAAHEAGHVVAAFKLDIPLGYVTIAADHPHVHRLHYRPRHCRGPEYLATFCLSGGVAEELLCGPGYCGDETDWRVTREVLAWRYSAGPLLGWGVGTRSACRP